MVPPRALHAPRPVHMVLRASFHEVILAINGVCFRIPHDRLVHVKSDAKVITSISISSRLYYVWYGDFELRPVLIWPPNKNVDTAI